MRYKIFSANQMVLGIAFALRLILPKTHIIHNVASVMFYICMGVFFYFIGWVVEDYLKKK